MVNKILSLLIVCGFVLTMYGCKVDCEVTCSYMGESVTETVTDVDKKDCEDCGTAVLGPELQAFLDLGGTCDCKKK
jgi:hypothetical protein